MRTIRAENDGFECQFRFCPGSGDTDRGMASGAKFPKQRPFGEDALPSGGMTDPVEDLAKLLVTGPTFDPKRSLSDGMVHLRRDNLLTNPIREFESLQPGDGKNQGIEFSLIEFAKARFDVPSRFGEDKVGTGVE